MRELCESRKVNIYRLTGKEDQNLDIIEPLVNLPFLLLCYSLSWMQCNLKPKHWTARSNLQEKPSHSHSRSSVFRESVEISHLLTPLFCSLTPQTLGSLMVAAVTAGVTGTSRGLKLWVKGTSPTGRIVIPKGWSKPLLFLFSFLSCLLVPDTSSQGSVWHNNF